MSAYNLPPGVTLRDLAIACGDLRTCPQCGRAFWPRDADEDEVCAQCEHAEDDL